ncbi:hypothetical protein [Salmonella enterica]|uniref:hypothetical protein n=1 Tax=Salmonella enterica TaxID=28901 RepID=UPI003D181DC6
MATTPAKKHPKSEIPQLSHDCRRKIQRAQDTADYTELYLRKISVDITPLFVPNVLSYIADDIKAIDKELISLGLFDEAMGKRPRKPDAK